MYNEDDSDYLEAKEQARLSGDAEQVALAERKEPEQLVELKASFTRSQLLDIVAERAIERMFGRYGNESLEHNIRKHVHALVEKAARDIVEREVTAQVGDATAKVLADGFQMTDDYGRPKGERKTVAAYVLDYLKGDISNYDRKPRWHATADKLVDKYLAEELKPHLEQLKRRCMEALDSSVSGKIREAVITGLGLKA